MGQAVEAERKNLDLPPEEREKNARMREKLRDIWKKNRMTLESQKDGFVEWEKEIRRKFGVLRAKSALLARTIDIGHMMKEVAEKEGDTTRGQG